MWIHQCRNTKLRWLLAYLLVMLNRVDTVQMIIFSWWRFKVIRDCLFSQTFLLLAQQSIFVMFFDKKCFRIIYVALFSLIISNEFCLFIIWFWSYYILMKMIFFGFKITFNVDITYIDEIYFLWLLIYKNRP